MTTPRLLTLCSALLATSCISTVAVKRIDPNDAAEGLVYSLPKTYLVVEPKPDGTLDVQFEFLPDPERTYAIKAETIGAKHGLDVTLSQSGLLKEVQWKPDSTTVADAAISAAAKLYEERAKDKAEAKKDAEKRVDDAKKKVADAEAVVKTARRALEIKQSELGALQLQLSQAKAQSTPNTATIDALDLAIYKKQDEIRFAQADLAAAETALAEANAALATAQSVDDVSGANANDPESAATQADGPKAWGGVVFEVVERYAAEDFGAYQKKAPIVAAPMLRAVMTRGDLQSQEAQIQFPTVAPVSVPVVATPINIAAEGSADLLKPESRDAYLTAVSRVASAKALLKFLEDEKVTGGDLFNAKKAVSEAEAARVQALTAEKNAGLVLLVAASAPVEFGELEFFPVQNPTPLVKLRGAQVGPNKLRVRLPDDTNSGSYRLKVAYGIRAKTPDGGTELVPQTVEVFFSVR